MSIVKIKGIVLRQINLNESDRIVTILTENQGKVEAIAKGCRKQKSQLLACTQMFSVSNFIIYEGNNLGRISQGELIQSFYALHSDLKLFAYSTYFAEIADAVALRDIPNRELFVLLCNALFFMVKEPKQAKLFKLAYQLKVAQIAGIRPVTNYCANCGAKWEEKTEQSYRFSIKAGGIICPKCFFQFTDSAKIGVGTVEAIKLIYETKFSRVNTIKIDYTIFNQMDRLLNVFLETHLDQKFKSLNFLESIKED